MVIEVSLSVCLSLHPLYGWVWLQGTSPDCVLNKRKNTFPWIQFFLLNWISFCNLLWWDPPYTYTEDQRQGLESRREIQWTLRGCKSIRIRIEGTSCKMSPGEDLPQNDRLVGKKSIRWNNAWCRTEGVKTYKIRGPETWKRGRREEGKGLDECRPQTKVQGGCVVSGRHHGINDWRWHGWQCRKNENT